MVVQKFYNEFKQVVLNGNNSNTYVNVEGANSVKVYNSSAIPGIIVVNDTFLIGGAFTVDIEGKELQQYEGKIKVELINSITGIGNATLIIKRYV